MEGVVYPLLAVGDVVWQAAIAAALAIFMGLMKMHTDRRVRIEAAATKKELNEIKVVGLANYTFSNHAMGVQKKALAVACRTKADITKDPVHIKDAEVAEQDYLDHQKGQARVDAQALISRAEEQARKVLESSTLIEARESVKTVSAEKKEMTDVAIDVSDITKTHDIKGVVELTPKDE